MRTSPTTSFCAAGNATPGSKSATSAFAPRVPEHAYPDYSAVGPGWKCKRGYRAVHESCEPVAVPDNAFLAVQGDRWQCKRGYRATSDDTRCEPIELPTNAYLDMTGHDWECEPGYLKRRSACTEISVPEHAYATYSDYGPG